MFKTRSKQNRPHLVAVRVTKDEQELLERLADQEDLTVSQLVRRALRKGLEIEQASA